MTVAHAGRVRAVAQHGSEPPFSRGWVWSLLTEAVPHEAVLVDRATPPVALAAQREEPLLQRPLVA